MRTSFGRQISLPGLVVARMRQDRARLSQSTRPSEIERPKSREETPKLGSECEEACQRNRLMKMGCFGNRRNLHKYWRTTLRNRCI